MYCRVHKLDNMINIICERCIFKNCNKFPIYNYINKTKRLYCGVHKLDNMIDVKSKRCIYENCDLFPSFNYDGKIAKYCKNHSHNDMKNIKSKTCIIKNCETQSSFNYMNEKKTIYCSVHKLENMINITKKLCYSCNLFQVSKRTNYLCSYCNPIKSVRIKTKELTIKSLLESNNIKFIHDKQISNECCLKYRPDFLIDCNTYYIVLEVDEDAHSHYDKDCEIIRMNNIITSIGLPTKFIRYNPDKKKISKKIKEEILIKFLKEEMEKEVLEDISPIYLFY